MYRILYEHDHENRAKALDGNIPHRQLATDPVVTIPGLKTLIYWGHGTPGFLCGMTPKDLAENVKAWRSANSKLSEIEMITCNSRHSPSGSDPFIEVFKQKLGFLARRRLTLRSVPMRMSGARNVESILFADYKSKTWCYVTAPRREFTFIKNIFKAICENDFDDDAIKTAVFLTSPPPRRTTSESRQNSEAISKFLEKCKVKNIRELHQSELVAGWTNVEKFMKDFRNFLKIDSVRIEFVGTRNYTLNYGTFDGLRSSLVKV